MFVDSLDKIIIQYISAVSLDTIEWKGKLLQPSPLIVRPNILRGFICSEKCGGCGPS